MLARPRLRLPHSAALLLFALVALVLTAGEAAAQAASEHIERIDVVLTIEEDGALLVEETIVYDFGSAERHGIIREVPVRFHYDDEDDRVYPLDVISVTGSPGTPVDYEVSEEGGAKRIRIGDPDETITGEHTYVITYRVRGALNAFEDHDELYWNAVGTEWSVPIDLATARVEAPAGIQRAICFAGRQGTTEPCDDATVSGSTATFAESNLGPSEALTVVVALPKGAVPEPIPVLEERWSFTRAFSLNPVTLGLFGVVALAMAGGVVRLVWQRGRDLRYAGGAVDAVFGSSDGAVQRVGLGEDVTTPVEYLPPDGLRPGQLGTLIDEAANPLDVTATVIDLAVRGYLRIEEVPKEGWFGKEDWRLVRLREADGDLREYERILHEAIFEDGEQVLLSDLKNQFMAHLSAVQDGLYDDAVAQKWFVRRPDRVRGFWVGVGLGVTVLGVALVVAAAVWTHYALVPVPVVLGGIALMVASHSMPHRTATGTSALRRALGFRRYISEAERDQSRFAEQQHLFSEYLPYAVVFGVTERWAKAFEGLDRAPRTDWYVSSHPFAIAAFASAVDGFTVSAAGTIASQPSSSGSSGFGGGGFSGGGGGGGGGGSW